MDSLSSRRFGSEIGRGILDLLERLVRLDSVEVARLPSDPGGGRGIFWLEMILMIVRLDSALALKHILK